MKNKRISWMKFSWLKKKEIWVLFYVPVYLLWFFALEQVTPEHPFIVTNPLDRYIPFCEYFIVPYLLWFPYLIGGAFLFLPKGKRMRIFQTGGHADCRAYRLSDYLYHISECPESAGGRVSAPEYFYDTCADAPAV